MEPKLVVTVRMKLELTADAQQPHSSGAYPIFFFKKASREQYNKAVSKRGNNVEWVMYRIFQLRTVPTRNWTNADTTTYTMFQRYRQLSRESSSVTSLHNKKK